MLSGDQSARLREGLQCGFPDAMRLQMFLREQLDKTLSDYAGPNDPLPAAIFRVIEGAQAEGWLEGLVATAWRARPKQPKIAQIAIELGVTPLGTNLTNLRPITGAQPVAPAAELESLLKPRRRFVDVDVFGAALNEQQARICRIELGTAGSGTGFLVGPDLVLTNDHVMELVTGNHVRAQDVVLRFDYLNSAEGKAIGKGVVCRLHPGDWLVDRSPWSQADKSLTGEPSEDELDYCLVRLSERLGEVRLGGPSDMIAPQRGWIACNPEVPGGVKGEHVLILQHPEGAPLKLAIGDHLGYNASGTRFRYDANTLPGSSGSPVFNADLRLIGLHHRGDPSAHALAMDVRGNQGIPVSRILALLRRRGRWPLA